MCPLLIYCAGKNQRFEATALAAGFQLGAQLPATIYHPIVFADQDWKQPNREAYMRALAEHQPRMATVLDLEQPEQLPEVLSWAEEAAQWAQQVLIIPKYSGAIDSLPRRIGRAEVVLAYSVPTAFGGTSVPLWEFTGWPVHLLGGSPHRQMELSCYLNVVSADGNMANKMAQRGRFWCEEKGPKGHWRNLREIGVNLPRDNNLEAFRRSCENIAAAWRKRRPTPPAALVARLERLGASVAYDPVVTHGYTAEWRVAGLGAPAWFGTIGGLSEWLDKQEQAKARAA
jgi:hypothetical protein